MGTYPGIGSSDEHVVKAVTSWDPDGDGPQPNRLIVAGYFTYSGSISTPHIAYWDGSSVRPLGAPYFPFGVYALHTWDEDGDGPAHEVLLAGGPGPVDGNFLAKFDGVSWSAFQSPLLGTVYSMTTWDRDGDGPQPPVLVVAGHLWSAGETAVNAIALWNGQNWESLGQGLTTTGFGQAAVLCVTTHDPDGLGPLPSELIVGGYFDAAGGVPADGVARWDGAQWHALPSTGSIQVNDLLSWDDDHDPSTPNTLFKGTSEDVYRLSENVWQPLRVPFPFTSTGARAIEPWDPDGDGPLPEMLFAGGDLYSNQSPPIARFFRSGLYAWNGASWDQVGECNRRNDSFSIPIGAIGRWDPDGAGPMREELVVGGMFQEFNSVQAHRIIRFDGTSWHGLGGGPSYPVRKHVFLPQGSAQQPFELSDGENAPPQEFVFQQQFSQDGSGFRNLGAFRTQSAWRVDGSMSGSVNAVTVWDPDGLGKAEPRLVIGGQFTSIGTTDIARIAEYDSSTGWRPVGIGLNGTVSALITMPDPNGSGSELLVAGGSFSSSGSVSFGGLAAYNDCDWQPWPAPVSPDGQGFVTITALALWDSDGLETTPRRLVASGHFGVPVAATRRIAAWDGAGWTTIPNLNDSISILCEWDADGPGGQTPRLIAAGPFTHFDSTLVNRIASWDGHQWSPLSTGLTDFAQYFPGLGSPPRPPVGGIASWDPDGPGNIPPQLVAGGAFRRAGGVLVNHIARWDGTSWHALGAGTSAPVYDLTIKQPPSGETSFEQLIVGGEFFHAGGIDSRYIAAYGCPLPSVPTCPGDVTGDARVDLADVGSLILIWDTDVPSGHPSDLNADGHIGLGDLASVIQNWASVCSN